MSPIKIVLNAMAFAYSVQQVRSLRLVRREQLHTLDNDTKINDTKDGWHMKQRRTILTKCGLIYRGNRTLDTKLCPTSWALKDEQFAFIIKKKNKIVLHTVASWYTSLLCLVLLSNEFSNKSFPSWTTRIFFSPMFWRNISTLLDEWLPHFW